MFADGEQSNRLKKKPLPGRRTGPEAHTTAGSARHAPVMLDGALHGKAN